MTQAAPVAEAQPKSAEPVLRLRGAGRRFGGLHAVRDVDLEVAPGERRALLGPNGAGKTTLFNVISGGQGPLQAALSKVVLTGPFGVVKLDANRQAIEDEWSYQIIAKPGQTLVKTVQWIPQVNQTFGGTFAATKPPPGRSFPPCTVRALPWSGKEKPVVNGVIQK